MTMMAEIAAMPAPAVWAAILRPRWTALEADDSAADAELILRQRRTRLVMDDTPEAEGLTLRKRRNELMIVLWPAARATNLRPLRTEFAIDETPIDVAATSLRQRRTSAGETDTGGAPIESLRSLRGAAAADATC